MASCSSPWSPFSGVGVFLLTSYLSISHLSLCEWPDIRLWAQTRCPLCGSSATTCGGTRRQHKATAPDTAATAKQHAKRHARQYARQHTTQHASPYKIDRRLARKPVNGLQRLARLGSTLLEWTDRRHALRLRRLAPRDSSPLPLTWLVVYCNSVCTTQHLARLRSTLLGCMDCTSFQLQPQLIAPVVWLFLLAWTPNNLQRLVPCTLLSLRGSL